MLITKGETAKFIGRSVSGLEKLLKKDSTFPRAIKLGATRQAPVYFDQADLVAWVESLKCRQMASMGSAICTPDTGARAANQAQG